MCTRISLVRTQAEEERAGAIDARPVFQDLLGYFSNSAKRYFCTPNVNTVSECIVCPGFSSVLGNFG